MFHSTLEQGPRNALAAGAIAQRARACFGHAVGPADSPHEEILTMKLRWGFVVTVIGLRLLMPSTTFAEEHGARLTDRNLQLATSASLLVTATLGTFVALNQPTLLSNGRCAAGDPLFGEWGCHGLSGVHGIAALISVVLYTSTQVLEVSRFDWPGRDNHGSGYVALSYVHLIGMALQPLGGLLAVAPEIVGASRNGLFPRLLRTLHIVLGYTIVASFLITTAIEL
jgi:hypothetical protein